jgi:hypothetical protein
MPNGFHSDSYYKDGGCIHSDVEGSSESYQVGSIKSTVTGEYQITVPTFEIVGDIKLDTVPSLMAEIAALWAAIAAAQETADSAQSTADSAVDAIDTHLKG